MKRILTILVAILLTVSVFARLPQKISYQAVIRNSSNDLITNKAVGMQISILQGSGRDGTVVYVERFSPTTNTNGLVSIEIGTGTVVSGNFTRINWANGPYFIKTETDLNGGANYTITGTSELLSVPYALYAEAAETVKGAHYIGESYGGGIIFWLDTTGQHGLIAATADQSTETQWYIGNYTVTNAKRNGVYAGMYNTERIIANQGVAGNAAQICANYNGGGYGDWYLPSSDELNLLYQQRNTVGGFANALYWSSNEYTNQSIISDAIRHDFSSGYVYFQDKHSKLHVRAIRAF